MSDNARRPVYLSTLPADKIHNVKEHGDNASPQVVDATATGRHRGNDGVPRRKCRSIKRPPRLVVPCAPTCRFVLCPAADPMMLNQSVGCAKALRIKSMTLPDDNEYRAEHRTDGHDDGHGLATAGQKGAYSPLPPPPAPLDPRSDRRKYLVPDQHLAQVVDACRRGVSEVRIARSLGINYRTWMRLRDEDERIAGALTETRKIEEEELVALLLDKAREGETTSLIFALKSRHGYRDQGAHQASADARVNVVINLPAASSSVDEYARTIDGSVTP